MRAKTGHTWSSILWERDMFCREASWRIENDNKIYVSRDPWIPYKENFKLSWVDAKSTSHVMWNCKFFRIIRNLFLPFYVACLVLAGVGCFRWITWSWVDLHVLVRRLTECQFFCVACGAFVTRFALSKGSLILNPQNLDREAFGRVGWVKWGVLLAPLSGFPTSSFPL